MEGQRKNEAGFALLDVGGRECGKRQDRSQVGHEERLVQHKERHACHANVSVLSGDAQYHIKSGSSYLTSVAVAGIAILAGQQQ